MFRHKAEVYSRNGQFCTDLRKSRDYKGYSPQRGSEEPHSKLYEGQGEIMKTITKDKIEGSFHEVKGTIKQEVGKVTNDRNLRAEGKAEKKAGKVQQRIGHAKEAVTKLKGQLAELKTA